MIEYSACHIQGTESNDGFRCTAGFFYCFFGVFADNRVKISFTQYGGKIAGAQIVPLFSYSHACRMPSPAVLTQNISIPEIG